MQQGGGRLSRHATVAVRGAGADTLKQAKHRTNADALIVERGHEWHFRRPRICETHLDARHAAGPKHD
jgi:hypothetical protein